MNVLAIGGSDPSSGAGIQSDIKAAHTLGANCFSVITAITAQNSQKFSFAESVSARSVGMQLDSVLSDFDIDVIVLGMVYDHSIIKKIHSKIKSKKIPIILDPVIKSTTQGVLLKKNAISALKKLLIPISHTITPNVSEAELLSGVKIKKYDDLIRAAKSLAKLGAKNIIITGHLFEKNKISDFVYHSNTHYSISGKKISGQNHGSGCNFAIALAYSIVKKNKIKDAVIFAKQFTYDAIRSSQTLGHGVKITNPKKDSIKSELGLAITQFENFDGISALIPECQTNFVFARPKAKSINDIAGIAGRIVKIGNKVMTAGSLEYGGSKHVATAVFTMQKKFPQIRSALNLKYNADLVTKFAKTRAKISSYDRIKEPKSNKIRENSSISWGVNQAIKNSAMPPDIIYHRGDFGKEPMIIVFGNNPTQVLTKISKIL
ncbi:MAG: bifunctional hydroxymethylpyrimidine kinase/phosphomethylpyrimidine kinase [Candidatus Nitrosotenuis sp.]